MFRRAILTIAITTCGLASAAIIIAQDKAPVTGQRLSPVQRLLYLRESESQREAPGEVVPTALNFSANRKTTRKTAPSRRSHTGTSRTTAPAADNQTSPNPVSQQAPASTSSIQDKLIQLRDTVLGPPNSTQGRSNPTQTNRRSGDRYGTRSLIRPEVRSTEKLTPPTVTMEQPTRATERPTRASQSVARKPSSTTRKPRPLSRPIAKPASDQPTSARRSRSVVSKATPKSENSQPTSVKLSSSRRRSVTMKSTVAEPQAMPEPTAAGPSQTASVKIAPPIERQPRVATVPREERAPADTVPEQANNKLPSREEVEATAEPAEDDNQALFSLQGPQISASAAGPRRIVISQPADFTITVRNTGSVAADDVVVVVNLPPWVDVARTGPSNGDAKVVEKTESSQPLHWRIKRFDAHSAEKLTLQIVPRKSQALNLGVGWTYAQNVTQTKVEVEEPLLNLVISGASEAVYGEEKVYNLTISNPGTGDANNVIVTLLPLDGNQDSPVSSNIGTLTSGATKTIQIELAAGKSGTLLIKAQAAADGGLNAEAAKEVLIRRAKLQVEATGPEARYAGTTGTFELKVANPGNATAEGVSVTAVLPAGVEFVSGGKGLKAIEGQGRVRWNIGSLSPGQALTMDMVCRMNSPGATRVRVTAQDDSDLVTSSTMVTNVIARADLKLSVLDPQGPVPVGKKAEYELTIVNRGTTGAKTIEAVIFFSDGIEPLTVEGGEHQIGRGQVIFKTIPEIAAGGELKLKVQALADRPGDHVFRVEVLCRSLGTKLAAEETTHYYGKQLKQDTPKPTPRQAVRPRYKPRAATPIEAIKR